MSEFSANSILSPTESLPRYDNDTPEQLVARQVYAEQVKKRLESLDASYMSFQGTGEVEVVIKVNGKAELYVLPIKAIPAHVLNEISAEYNACAGKIPRKRFSDIGPWDEAKKGHIGGWDQDMQHPQYTERVAEFTRLTQKLRIDKILHGLDIPLKDRRGNVVWDPNDELGRDYAGAVEALQRLRLSEKQLDQIQDAIDNLSIEVETEDEQDWAKKSSQP